MYVCIRICMNAYVRMNAYVCILCFLRGYAQPHVEQRSHHQPQHIYVCIYTCMYTWVKMCVHLFLFECVCMYFVFLRGYTQREIYMYTNICIYIYTYLYIYIHVFLRGYTQPHVEQRSRHLPQHIYVCMYVCMYEYVYICMYV